MDSYLKKIRVGFHVKYRGGSEGVINAKEGTSEFNKLRLRLQELKERGSVKSFEEVWETKRR